MTVFEKIKKMNKKELGEFVRRVYNCGWFDRADSKDDELFYGRCLMDQSESILEMLGV